MADFVDVLRLTFQRVFPYSGASASALSAQSRLCTTRGRHLNPVPIGEASGSGRIGAILRIESSRQVRKR